MQRVYYVNEQNGNELNALTKARQDVRYILDEIGWNEKLIHRKIESQNKIIHYFRMGFWTVWDWTHLLNNLEEHAILLIQFPMINSLIFNEIAAKLISKEKEKKYLKVILLIHDIDSIRFPDQEMKQKKHELAFWNIADVFIAHNTGIRRLTTVIGIFKIVNNPLGKNFRNIHRMKRNAYFISRIFSVFKNIIPIRRAAACESNSANIISLIFKHQSRNRAVNTPGERYCDFLTHPEALSRRKQSSGIQMRRPNLLNQAGIRYNPC